MKQSTELLNWEIERQQGVVSILFIGSLTKDTLTTLWKQQDKLIAALDSPIAEFNLSQLSELDSAGFVVLCNLFRAAEKKKLEQLKIIGTQDCFCALAKLFDVEEWLEEYI